MVDHNIKGELVRLSDTDLIVMDPEEDIRGFAVMDDSGDEIGEIEDLIIDTEEKKVRFLQIASGGFLGLGEKRYLVPVDTITAIEDGVVRISKSWEHVAGSPEYDPDIESPEYWQETYDYYGYPPYWGAGYVYPGMPFVR